MQYNEAIYWAGMPSVLVALYALGVMISRTNGLYTCGGDCILDWRCRGECARNFDNQALEGLLVSVMIGYTIAASLVYLTENKPGVLYLMLLLRSVGLIVQILRLDMHDGDNDVHIRGMGLYFGALHAAEIAFVAVCITVWIVRSTERHRRSTQVAGANRRARIVGTCIDASLAGTALCTIIELDEEPSALSACTSGPCLD